MALSLAKVSRKRKHYSSLRKYPWRVSTIVIQTGCLFEGCHPSHSFRGSLTRATCGIKLSERALPLLSRLCKVPCAASKCLLLFGCIQVFECKAVQTHPLISFECFSKSAHLWPVSTAFLITLILVFEHVFWVMTLHVGRAVTSLGYNCIPALGNDYQTRTEKKSEQPKPPWTKEKQWWAGSLP